MPTGVSDATIIEPLLDGRYRLHEELGRGGGGTVYLATDERLGREVAIKVLRLAAGADRRFEREVRAVGAIGHPGLVPVFDVGTTPEGAPFVVMERLRGETLDRRIERDGALSLAQSLDVCLAIAEALEAAHAVGLCHRDVKPGNIMLALLPQGRVRARLLDFGLASLVSEPERLTAAGAVVGSLAYLPAERLRGGASDARGDVYGLGLVLYEALAGVAAFDAPSAVGLRAKILTTEPPPLSTHRGDVPVEVSALIERAIQRDPNRRFATMTDMVSALRMAGDLLSNPSVTTRLPISPESQGESREHEIGSPRAPVHTLPPGITIGGTYRLVRPIGSGGMSVVYEAIDVELDRRVAVKVPRGGVDIDRLAFARLEREARAAASLGHPNVVGVYDVGVDPTHGAYLVMELLSGEPLLTRIRRKGMLTSADAIDITLEVLDGLAAAHGAGMIHRDIKPANVLLVPLASGGHLVKVLDFGIVKLREERESPKLTHRGAAIGTPAYMAPEQLRMEEVDARADVYAVGATLYEMLTGGLPPRGATGALMGDDAVRTQLDLAAVADGRLRHILQRAMAYDRADRYPHAGAMRDAMVGLRTRPESVRPAALAVSARATRQGAPDDPPTSGTPTVAARPGVAATRSAGAPAASLLARPRHRRSIVAVIAVSVVTAAAAGLWAVARSSGVAATTEVAPPMPPRAVADVPPTAEAVSRVAVEPTEPPPVPDVAPPPLPTPAPVASRRAAMEAESDRLRPAAPRRVAHGLSERPPPVETIVEAGPDGPATDPDEPTGDDVAMPAIIDPFH